MAMPAGSAHLALQGMHSQRPQASELDPQAALWGAGRQLAGGVESLVIVTFFEILFK